MKTNKNSKEYTFHKLLKRNLHYILIFIIPTILLVGLICLLHLQMIKSETLTKGAALARQSACHVDDALQKIVSSSYRVAYDPKVGIFIDSMDEEFSTDFIRKLKDVQEIIAQEAMYSDVVCGAMIGLSPEMYFINSKSGWHFTLNQWSESSFAPRLEFSLAMQMLGSIMFHNNTNTWQTDESNLYYLRSIVNHSVPRGYMITYTDFSTLADVMTSSLPYSGTRLLMVNENDIVVADSQLEGRGNAMYSLFNFYSDSDCFFSNGGMAYSVNWIDSLHNGWRYALITPQNGYRLNQMTILILYFTLFLVVLVSFIYVAHKIARATCRPYDQILFLLSNPISVTPEEYSRDYQPYDELGMISTLIYKTRYQNLVLNSELSEQQTLLKKAQQAALQAQMSPHFLYNTLESLNWMAIQDLGENNRVSEMVMRLARFSRIVTRNDEPLVSIRKEIEHAMLYLDIQKLRFEDQFTIHWDVDPQLLDHQTVRVSLQPLLENSLKYGVRDFPDGRIDVTCHRENDHILICVQDNGPGIDPDTLARLRQQMNAPFPSSENVGLLNLHIRIRLLFGPAYGLSIESANRITRITMTIPLCSVGTNKA